MASAESCPHHAIVIDCCFTAKVNLKKKKHNIVFSDISGSHGVKYEGDCLLGCVVEEKLTNVSEEVSARGACDEAVHTSETALRNIPEGHHVHIRVETANNFRSRIGQTVEGSCREIL
jgi:hypothetical protein